MVNANQYRKRIIARICIHPGLIPLFALALLLAGCGKKEETAAPSVAPVATNVVEVAPVESKFEKVKAPQAFSNPTEQKQFEELFDDAKDSFNAPTPGMLVRVEQEKGDPIVGDLIRFVPDGVVISSEDNPVTVKKSDMKEDTRAEFFVESFAAKMAKLQMESGIMPDDGEASIYPPAKRGVIEVRTLSAERMAPRAGPGRTYKAIDENVVFRGTALRVLDEIDGWICVSEDTETAEMLGWIPKFASGIPLSEKTRERVSAEVEQLKSDGFLKSIDPELYEAVVDSYRWRIADSASVEGICRLLARYCGQQRNVRVYFIAIKDADTGRKIAEFSESRGLKLF